MSEKDAVYGMYSTRAGLESAVDALRAKGFRSEDISVLSAPHPEFADLHEGRYSAHEMSVGPSTGSKVGGTLGWLVGMSALAMASGVFIVAGPIMAGLARMGTAVSDIASGLAGFGVPETAAREYEGRILSGGMLLSIHSADPEWLAHGRLVFEQTGAEEVTSVAEA
ncbi:MAG TPA: hypothetical protein VHZ73_02205 [Vicinamibacterales bacterium]|jgi:hypothetical protein|nr:hypothetical protein [Vicinamibacterales bacterium]